MLKFMFVMFLSGLLFGSGPCLVSCGPVLLTYIIGTEKNVKKSLLAYLLFSTSRIFVYVLLSLLIYFLGKFTLEGFLGNWSRFYAVAAGAVLILIGLLLLKSFKIKFNCWQSLKHNLVEKDGKSLLLLGLITGLLPCGPLLGILSYIALVSKSWDTSILLSMSFGIGTLLSPLVVLVLLAGFMQKFLKEQSEKINNIINIVCAVILIYCGTSLILMRF